MTISDFIQGKCPYCIGYIHIHPEYGLCDNIRTKICSNSEKYFRIFMPGDILPLSNYPNYYGDILPSSFIWIISGKTACCNKNIAVLVYNKIIGNFIKLEDIEYIDIPITIFIYNEPRKCIMSNPNLQYKKCIDEIKINGLVSKFATL